MDLAGLGRVLGSTACNSPEAGSRVAGLMPTASLRTSVMAVAATCARGDFRRAGCGRAAPIAAARCAASSQRHEDVRDDAQRELAVSVAAGRRFLAWLAMAGAAKLCRDLDAVVSVVIASYHGPGSASGDHEACRPLIAG